MTRGGARPNAGRKKGGRNKATIEREEFAQRGLDAAKKSKRSPLEVILAVMNGSEDVTDKQFAAAQAAAPYVHARLSNATVKSITPFAGWTPEQLEQAAELLERNPALAESFAAAGGEAEIGEQAGAVSPVH